MLRAWMFTMWTGSLIINQFVCSLKVCRMGLGICWEFSAYNCNPVIRSLGCKKVSVGGVDVLYFCIMWTVSNFNLCSFINTSLKSFFSPYLNDISLASLRCNARLCIWIYVVGILTAISIELFSRNPSWVWVVGCGWIVYMCVSGVSAIMWIWKLLLAFTLVSSNSV